MVFHTIAAFIQDISQVAEMLLNPCTPLHTQIQLLQSKHKHQKASALASASLAFPSAQMGAAAFGQPGGSGSSAAAAGVTHESHYAKIQAMMAEMTQQLHESSNQAITVTYNPGGWAAGGGFGGFLGLHGGGLGSSEKSNGVGYGGDTRGDTIRDGGAAVRAAAAARAAQQLHGDKQALAALKYVREMLSPQAARGSSAAPQLSAVVVAVLDSRGLRYCLRLLLQNDSLAGRLT